MADNKIAMRPDVVPYLNTGTSESPIWTQCGDGWKKFSENPNAQTEDTKYINSASEKTDTVSYKPQYSFECDLMYTDPTVKKVYDIAKDRKIGSDAVLDFLIVDEFDKNEDGTMTARREQLAVAVSSIDGDKKMTMSGNLNGQGDGVKGKFVKATNPAEGASAGTFTPDEKNGGAEPATLSSKNTSEKDTLY
ncbi:MAG: hypothetical protein K2J11_11525 [Oscillospiraceae bacterium]|nr:hypothetical protein [Oscillospiraceae bacterium]